MKKTLLLIAAILMSVSVFAQTRTTFLSEHFDSSSAPAGWQVQGAGTSNWGISATQYAGGEPNELVLVWSPQFNGTSRMVKKWFNIDTPGYDAPSAGTLRVASGAKVTLLGDEAISATTISGGGTVDGDLVLSGEGIDLEIGAGGTLPCFTVTGAADLSNGGTVTISGRFRDLQPGAYTILSASSLSFGGEWSVSAATTARTFGLERAGDTLVLKVFKNGAVLFIE